MKVTLNIIAARGIGEHLGNNMATRFANNFKAKLNNILYPDDSTLAFGKEIFELVEVNIVEIPWSAEYGPVPNPKGESFEGALKGLEVTLNEVFSLYEQKVTPSHKQFFWPVGYSGGAEGIGNWLTKISEDRLGSILGVTLISDPSMPKGISNYKDRLIGEQVWGIRKSRTMSPELKTIVDWVHNPNDLICCCPENSWIRAVAASTPAASLGDPLSWLTVPQKLGVYGAAKLTAARIRQTQDFLNPFRKTTHDYEKLIRDFNMRLESDKNLALGYLIGDEHVGYPYKRDPNEILGSSKTYFDTAVDRAYRRSAAYFNA